MTVSPPATLEVRINVRALRAREPGHGSHGLWGHFLPAAFLSGVAHVERSGRQENDATARG